MIPSPAVDPVGAFAFGSYAWQTSAAILTAQYHRSVNTQRPKARGKSAPCSIFELSVYAQCYALSRKIL